MNAGQFILIVMCAWVVAITAAYLRECTRRKRLRCNLDKLLVRMTAFWKDGMYDVGDRIVISNFAQTLGKIINKEL